MSPSRRRRRASPEWEGRDVITVAALPGRGLYVRHLGHPEGVDGVHRPTVVQPGSQHRPAGLFDPRWLAEHLDEVDVVHVQGLHPRQSPDEVRRTVEQVRAAGKPLVVTLYHLTDPTGTDEAGFAAQLDALVPEADLVITLTPPAVAETERRWSITPELLPHPHVVDFVRMRQSRPAAGRGRFVIGAHLGSLRFPADPVATVESLTRAVATLDDAHLQVHVHDHLLDPESSRYSPAVIRTIDDLVRGIGGTVRAHRPLTDSQLWDHLFGVGASFVPPLAGSHSIWPEACFDLGTAAIMPAGGCAAAQHDCHTYPVTADGTPEIEELAVALRAAQTAGGTPRADPQDRWKERVGIAESLRGWYEKLLAGRS